jgi:hypothetical protein
MSNGIQEYARLENRLLLLAWLNRLLGYKHNRDLLQDMKDVEEGFGADGRSFLLHHLLGRGAKVAIPEATLTRYDDNIRTHLAAMNRGRAEPITLRYFQHLAALYTEIVLDRLFTAPQQLLADLNAFVAAHNTAKTPGEVPDDPFTAAGLNKLAFWMATGSGKTLLLHLNIRQFLHYNRTPLDNILLITPNEGLSEQHLDELAASGIAARRFDLNAGGLWSSATNTVQVIEITKLVEQKRGGGASVPVEAFEGRNLILVDEGHKGSGGEAWRSYRDALGAGGFTFEYSATFGQALSAAGNDALTAEYGKAIVFDYSYRYFYGDGFGKDFRILNLKTEASDEQTATLLLGNLLAFYEQLLRFEQDNAALRPYHLETPLWVFVGSTVNAVYSENKQKRSDVLTVVRFLHRVLHDSDWAEKTLGKLLKASSGLVGADGADVFLGRFAYLHAARQKPGDLYKGILKRVFHTDKSGGLHLADIRGGSGELGLKAAGDSAYFGLIYIGDTAAFKTLAAEEAAEITVEQDVIADALFSDINKPDSPVRILIGAKKFIEGWNSWRVATMGLLNIGRSEGSQIIQLFGRGVRLRGKGHSLKRSAVLDGPHPEHIGLLETLNIFAVRANYMAQFRNYLEREGVETEPTLDLPLFTYLTDGALEKKLVAPRPPTGRSFVDERSLLLAADPKLRIQVNLAPRVVVMQGTTQGLHIASAQAGGERQIPAENLALVDWQQLYLDLLAYKERKGWSNLIIHPDTPRRLLQELRYGLIAGDEVVNPSTFGGRTLLQEAVTAILRKYVDVFYSRRQAQWEGETLVYQPLDAHDPNLELNHGAVGEAKTGYIVKVRRSDSDLIKAIKKLQQDAERLKNTESSELPRISFDRHLYLPLLVEESEKLQSIPPALKPSEADFVRDLMHYWEAERSKSLAGKEIYLLRNLSKGKGVSFFAEKGFYPDFILWVLDGARQRIIFVEPHGMLHATAYVHDEKAQLHERLVELAQEIGRRSGRDDITLDAFIVSATAYEDLYRHYEDGTWSREKFAEKHILFRERRAGYDYMRRLLAGG